MMEPTEFRPETSLSFSPPPLARPTPARLPCQMKRQKSSWKMKYANDVASVVVLTAELTRCLSLSLSLSLFALSPPPLNPSWLRHCFAKTTGGALNDAPATLSTSYAMAALQGLPGQAGWRGGRRSEQGAGSREQGSLFGRTRRNCISPVC